MPDREYGCVVGSREEEYFSGHVLSVFDEVPELYQFLDDGTSIDSISIQAPQMRYRPFDGENIPPNPDSEFVPFKSTTGDVCVVAPNGTAYEMLSPSQQPWKVLIHVRWSGASVFLKLARNSDPSITKLNAFVTQVEIGKFAAGTFHPEDSQLVPDHYHYKHLFYASKWPSSSSAPEDDLQDPHTPSPSDLPSKYEFETMGNCTMLRKTSTEGETTYTVMTTFELCEFKQSVDFIEAGHFESFYVILCRKLYREGGEDVYLGYEDEDRVPTTSRCGYLYVEVPVKLSAIRDTTDLCRAFSAAHSDLVVAHMNADMFRAWIISQPTPPKKRAIVRLGRQLDGSFVTSNAVFFPNGTTANLSDTSFIVVKEFFAQFDLRPSNLPKNYIINDPWVRYFILRQWWHRVIPAYFQTNTVQARVAFCLGIMGLYTTRIFKSEGVTVGDVSSHFEPLVRLSCAVSSCKFLQFQHSFICCSLVRSKLETGLMWSTW